MLHTMKLTWKIQNPIKKNAGFTPQERKGFDNFITNGFVDTFREFCQDPNHYTWWSYMFNSRSKNVGWRIDYFLASKSILPLIHNEEVLISPPEDLGARKSDHSPIKIEVDI